ncbi:dihydrofolate reductase family protein [Nocardioides euryhalodurans]|uniref:Pyrimidine reductase family protein n=1 Tax=Nocardioides euryhalodurans TaxID=2518370 RepID=A0A4P7GMP3_9ACTN|nr:dihydrofolate reductase family protein [Nocardioides euryhalodurans]QBR93416.1 pyrimidine reductase family protein [Nocardioides euryhalodurans]
MRVLIGPDASLREVYAAPDGPWLRANMVATVDGASTGVTGTSSSINNEADKIVFDLLRELSDALVVGAGTIRAERYRPNPKPVVVVSRSGSVPETLRGPGSGPVLMATCSQSPGLGEARELLGEDQVIVLGSHRLDLRRMRAELAERGFEKLLSEGGPHALRDLLDQGCVDEIDTTIVPRVIGGHHPRITDGAPVDVPLTLHTLVEHEGTLLTRWMSA